MPRRSARHDRPGARHADHEGPPRIPLPLLRAADQSWAAPREVRAVDARPLPHRAQPRPPGGRVMSRARRLSTRCCDCRTETLSREPGVTTEYYMVHDHVWEAARAPGRG